MLCGLPSPSPWIRKKTRQPSDRTAALCEGSDPAWHHTVLDRRIARKVSPPPGSIPVEEDFAALSKSACSAMRPAQGYPVGATTASLRSAV